MRATCGVIFDMDGVLVDSADAHRRAWQQLGEEIGTPFSAQRFRDTFGQRNESIIPSWLGPAAAQRLQELAARKEELYRDFVRQGAVRIYPRVMALLTELRARGVRLAVASSGPRANVGLLIERIGAASLIDASVAAEDVSEGKPHPEAFLRAAEQLAVPPGPCAVVEDSVHGIEAAKRAGMLAVAVLTSTARTALAAAGADHLIDTVADLPVDWLLDVLQRRAEA